MSENFSYDEYSDSLIVSDKQENEKVKENFEAGDIIFSLTGKGKIVSIEIREFSSFLENCGIDQSILKNLKDIRLKILPKRNTIYLFLKIESLNKDIILSNDIPFVVPLINQ